MNARADSPGWPQSRPAPSLLDRLVGVADDKLRIALADPRLAALLGFMGSSLEQRDLHDLVPDERAQLLLLFAVRGVAPEVQLPSRVPGTVLVARGAVTGSDRSLLLYERSASGPPTARASQAGPRHFVGRETELAAFDRFLVSDEPGILYVQGPHGFGKSALLGEFEARCIELDCPHVTIDARSSPMADRAIVDAIATSIGASQTSFPRLHANGRLSQRKWVLFVDNFDAWVPEASTAFREVFDVLPPGVSIVIAGRRHAERRWWKGCSRDTALLSLSPLDRASSEALLQLYAARPEAREEILSRAKGHPICLVTLANVSRMPGDPSAAFDLVDTALDPELPHALLQIASLPARITEDILAELLDEGPAAHDVYDLLTTICPRDASGIGLRMPWFLRTTIARNLRRRNPDRFATLRARLAASYARRLQRCTSAQLPSLVEDVLESFAHVTPATMLIGDSAEVQVYRPGPGELVDVTAASQRLGGERAAMGVERRMMIGLGATYVAARGSVIDGVVQFSISSLEAVTRAAGDFADVPLTIAGDALRSLGLAGRDVIAVCTTWITPALALDKGAASKALWLLLLRNILAAMPRVAAAAFVVPPNELSLPRLIPGVQTVRAGAHSVVLWSLRHASVGAALLAMLELTELTELTEGIEGLEVLGGQRGNRMLEDTLITVENVRSALTCLASPEKLAASPLISSRVVEAAAQEAASSRTWSLARLLRGAIDAMAGSPREAKARDVLLAVFLGEGGKHEQIARDMGLPYGTFRRYLAQGLVHVTETLRDGDRNAFVDPSPSQLPAPGAESVDADQGPIKG